LRLLTTLLTLAIIAVASGHTQVASAKQNASSTAARLKHSTDVLQFFDNHSWLMAPRQEKCGQVPWQRSCVVARKLVKVHTARVATLKREMWYTVPATNDWRTAVRLAQRPYPGTESWLLFISDREGGYGPCVMNHEGSGAGCWMQFMSSTFYAHVYDAKADFERRGFSVADEIWTWKNPLGQALTAGYMRYTHQDGCHWCL
jgi:hypothetical protein